ncbi:MAG: FAD-dependent oxidoreductase [Kiloniellales bacterium]
MSGLGSQGNPVWVAIVGSGPAGFYAAEALIRSGLNVRVDILERLCAPYGLVRSGVAPDHPKLKEPIRVYDKIARAPEVSFLGNVTVGRDLGVDELRATHHAIVFACGAETDRAMGIPGEELPGSHTATEFVGWYNGHPDYRDRVFDLAHQTAVIIGQGNVAADVCRILAKTADELRHTDIAEHALEALAESQIREIHVIGRRGPAQAKFAPAELKELGELDHCDPVVDPGDLELDAQSRAELAQAPGKVLSRKLDVFREFAARPAPMKRRRSYFHFLESPIELVGEGRLERVVLERNRLEGEPFHLVARGTGETRTLECGLLFRSIGYRGVPIDGVPFDQRRGVFANRDGRLIDDGRLLPGLYATGWIKRGPTGLIGTNRADSVATVEALIEDLPGLGAEAKPGGDAVLALMEGRGVRVVSYADWQKIDAAEVGRGAPNGKPREKFTRTEEMLAALS